MAEVAVTPASSSQMTARDIPHGGLTAAVPVCKQTQGKVAGVSLSLEVGTGREESLPTRKNMLVVEFFVRTKRFRVLRQERATARRSVTTTSIDSFTTDSSSSQAQSIW